MKPSTIAPALILLLAASCSSTAGSSDSMVLMSTGRVTVTADLDVDGETWSLRNIRAAGTERGSVNLRDLSVTAFTDLDADGEVGEDERRGSWKVESGRATQSLAAAGKLTVGSLGNFDASVWKLEVRVVYDALGGSDEDRAVVSFLD